VGQILGLLLGLGLILGQSRRAVPVLPSAAQRVQRQGPEAGSPKERLPQRLQLREPRLHRVREAQDGALDCLP